MTNNKDEDGGISKKLKQTIEKVVEKEKEILQDKLDLDLLDDVQND